MLVLRNIEQLYLLFSLLSVTHPRLLMYQPHVGMSEYKIHGLLPARHAPWVKGNHHKFNLVHVGIVPRLRFPKQPVRRHVFHEHLHPYVPALLKIQLAQANNNLRRLLERARKRDMPAALTHICRALEDKDAGSVCWDGKPAHTSAIERGV